MNTRNNKRFQKTEQRILECALTLIEKNPNRPISVTAICEELSINRTSFYLHHKSVQSVLDAIMTQYHAELMEQYQTDANTVSAAVQRCFLFAAEHQRFYRYYTRFSDNPGLSWKYLQECFEDPVSSRLADCQLTDLQLSYLGDFMEAGVSEVINRWLSSGKEDSVDEILDLLVMILSPVSKQKSIE